MSFHDSLATKALMMGKTSQEFKRAAQRHANITWVFLIIAAAVWYLAGLWWAVIPVAVGAFTAFQSISSTMVQSRLEKMEK